jgi:hypothetical protein
MPLGNRRLTFTAFCNEYEEEIIELMHEEDVTHAEAEDMAYSIFLESLDDQED